MDLWPGDFWEQCAYMVKEVNEVINPLRKKKYLRPVRSPSKDEMIKFVACLVAAAQYSERGVNLFGGKRSTDERKGSKHTLRKTPDFSVVMSHNRFCEIKAIAPLMMEGKDDGTDDWWKFRGFIDGFNQNRRERLFISKVVVLDESMSGFWPR